MGSSKKPEIPQPLVKDERKPYNYWSYPVPKRPKRRNEDQVGSMGDMQYINSLIIESTHRREMKWDPPEALVFKSVKARKWEALDLKGLNAICCVEEPKKKKWAFSTFLKSLFVSIKGEGQTFLGKAVRAWNSGRSFDYAIVHNNTIKGAVQLKPHVTDSTAAVVSFMIAPWAGEDNLATTVLAMMTLKAMSMGFQRVYVPQRDEDPEIEYLAYKLGFRYMGAELDQWGRENFARASFAVNAKDDHIEHLTKMLEESRLEDLVERIEAAEADVDVDDSSDDSAAKGQAKADNKKDDDDDDDDDDDESDGGARAKSKVVCKEGSSEEDEYDNVGPASTQAFTTATDLSVDMEEVLSIRRRIIVKDRRRDPPPVSKLVRNNSRVKGPKMKKRVRFANPIMTVFY